MSWGAFLSAAAGPLAKRVLTSLGIGVVAYVGLDLAVGQLLGQARTAWGGMGADVANYLSMAGVNSALAIIAGAIVARVTMVTLKKLALL